MSTAIMKGPRQRWLLTGMVVMGVQCLIVGAHAEEDHLVGYKVKDALGLKPPGLFDLTNAELAASASQCELKKPKFMLLQGAKNGGDDPRGGPAGKFVCYKAKCDSNVVGSSISAEDQFDPTHSLEVKKAQLVCAPFVDPSAPRFVDNGDGTVSDVQTGLIWEMKTDDCPAGYTASGNYTTNAPSSGTFTFTFDASGVSWTGSTNDSVAGATSDCAGTVTGSSFTGTCYSGVFTVSGTINCGGQSVSITISGPASGSGSGTATGTDVHDVYVIYTWSPGTNKPDGTAFTDLLGTLNNGRSVNGNTISGCFAGQCDWRLPTSAELQTILLDPYPCGTDPCIDSVFGPTQSGDYWSATRGAFDQSEAWVVNFTNGLVGLVTKTNGSYVRAVRGAHVPTVQPCEATTGGFCWYLGTPNPPDSCDTVCGSAGRVYDPATASYAGSGGTLANCLAVVTDLLGAPPATGSQDLNCIDVGAGCFYEAGFQRAMRCQAPPTTSSAQGGFGAFDQRACACQ